MAKKTKKQARQARHYRVRNKISSGTSSRPRLSVFKSNTSIYVQLIDDSKGLTLASSSSKKLNLPNNNVENSKKVGQDIAKKINDLGIKEIVFDRGGFLYHGKVKALAEEVRNSGIKF